MNKGVPTLQNPHKLCEKGKPLTGEQAQILKLIGERMVTFRVGLISRWDSVTGEVIQIEGAGTLSPEDGVDGDKGDEDGMSE
jgi:mRNA turnover protein 4